MAIASSVIVPDDYSTVQAAVDSGADSVLIREGDYPEALVSTRGVTLRGIGATRIRMDGLAIFNHNQGSSIDWRLSRITFTRRVDITTNAVHPRLLDIRFDECALEAGLKHLVSLDPHDIETLSFNRCRIGGPSDARATDVYMNADTVEAGVSWGAVDILSVTDCWFRGVGGRGLDVRGDELAGAISGNTFEGFEVGIYADDLDRFSIASNTIMSASVRGVFIPSGGVVEVRENEVLGCETGMVIRAERPEIIGNRVLSCASAGLSVAADRHALVEGNVVGGCGGTGIVVDDSGAFEVTLRNNTVFENGGSGIAFVKDVNGTISVLGSISSGNTLWGLDVLPDMPVNLGCNDWFGNGLGPTNGILPGSTDVAAAPLFCNVASADVTLRADSPLLDAPGCGLIGALGLGCEAPPTSVVVVPDDFATIQSAIDAQPDTVLVRPGVYDERVVSTRGIVLLGIGDERPRLAGLAVLNQGEFEPTTWVVRGMDFSEDVLLSTTRPHPRLLKFTFTDCAMNSGLFHESGDPADIEDMILSRCRIEGNAVIYASALTMEADTISGEADLAVEFDLSIVDCWFQGNGTHGLNIQGQSLLSGAVAGNRIDPGYARGIAARNLVRFTFEGNAIRGATSRGLDFASSDVVAVRGNKISDCGFGIAAEAEFLTLEDNVVLRSSRDGMELYPFHELVVVGNVVGNSGWAGVSISSGTEQMTHVAANTVFNNVRSGFEFRSAFEGPGTVLHNIGFGNGAYGLSGTPALSLHCNNWFGNTLGSVSGAPLGQSDLNHFA